MRVTLTFDPSTRTTVVDDQGDARGPVAVAEPEGILGACSTGSLYAWSGRDVTIRRVRLAVHADLGAVA